MSEQLPPPLATAGSVPPDPDRPTPLDRTPAPHPGAGAGGRRLLPAGGAGRSVGLVIALLILCAVGVATAGERFASLDNLMTILRLAAVIGVLSIGMTFVITGGGIDLSVGSVLGLAHRVLVIAEGRVLHSGPAQEIDEHRVLDLVMEGSAA